MHNTIETMSEDKPLEIIRTIWNVTTTRLAQEEAITRYGGMPSVADLYAGLFTRTNMCKLIQNI